MIFGTINIYVHGKGYYEECARECVFSITMRIACLTILAWTAHASEFTNDMSAVPVGEERLSVNVPLTGAEVGALSDTCPAATTFARWVNISTRAVEYDYTDLLPRADSTTQGLSMYCSGSYCGAYAEGNYAGAYCQGDGCALAAFGTFAGYACVGVNCAARTTR